MRPFLHRPVIDTDNARWLTRGKRLIPNEAQDGVGAGRHSEMHEEPGTRFTSQRDADPPLCLRQSLGASGIGLEKTRERLRKGLLQASMIVAVEAPHPNAERNLTPEGWEVRRLPVIGAVHAATEVPACRAAAMGGAPSTATMRAF